MFLKRRIIVSDAADMVLLMMTSENCPKITNLQFATLEIGIVTTAGVIYEQFQADIPLQASKIVLR
jgi:hypothetical protein